MKRSLRLAVLASVIAIVLGLATTVLAEPTAAPVDTVFLTHRVIELTNERRAAAGLEPLKWNGALAASAADYAHDMASRDYFSHFSPEGTTPVDRNRDAGYPSFWWGLYVGENLAKGFDSPEAAMEGWMASQGHRENLLRPDWEEIGVGIAVASNGTLFWAQEFGNRPADW